MKKVIIIDNLAINTWNTVTEVIGLWYFPVCSNEKWVSQNKKENQLANEKYSCWIDVRITM